MCRSRARRCSASHVCRPSCANGASRPQSCKKTRLRSFRVEHHKAPVHVLMGLGLADVSRVDLQWRDAPHSRMETVLEHCSWTSRTRRPPPRTSCHSPASKVGQGKRHHNMPHATIFCRRNCTQSLRQKVDSARICLLMIFPSGKKPWTEL